MTNSDAIPLHLHTLETLTTELLAGRPIPLGETATTGEVIHLDEAARKIFHWYSRNRPVWAKNCMKEDVEDLAAAVAGPVPTGKAGARR